MSADFFNMIETILLFAIILIFTIQGYFRSGNDNDDYDSSCNTSAHWWGNDYSSSDYNDSYDSYDDCGSDDSSGGSDSSD